MNRHLLPLLVVAASLSACTEIPDHRLIPLCGPNQVSTQADPCCETPEMYEEGICETRPDVGMDADVGLDADADTTPDADADMSLDAEVGLDMDMGTMCDAIDFVEDGKCVACRTGMDDCSSDAGTGACVENQCVECDSSQGDMVMRDAPCQGLDGGSRPFCGADNMCVGCVPGAPGEAPVAGCTTPEEPTCSATNECGGCTADADCARFAVPDDASRTLVCGVAGACVECVLDSHCVGAGPMGGNQVCDPTTNTCEGRAPRSTGACEECFSDTQCGANQACVPTTSGQMKYRCLSKKITANCLPPYPKEVIGATTRNEVTGETYCSPVDANVSCEALLARGVACSTLGNDAVCTGAAGAQTSEVRCVIFKSGPAATDLDTECTYLCTSNEDCNVPAGETCRMPDNNQGEFGSSNSVCLPSL